MGDVTNDPAMQSLLPGTKPFITFYSPMNHDDDYNCELLSFHARDDDNVPFADAMRFTTTLKSKNKNIGFVQAPAGITTSQ